MLIPSALLAAVLSPLLAAAPAPAPVTLTFAWPANLKGSVKHTYAAHTSPNRPAVSGEQEYRFSVQEAAGGLRKLVPSDVRYRRPEEIMAMGEPYTVLFDSRGAFKGVERAKGDLVDRMTNGPLPLPPEKQAEIRKQLEDMINSEVREKWDKLTGRWSGVTLTPGKPSKRAVKLGIGSMMVRQEVDATEVTTLEAGVACHPAAAGKACVRLTVETTPTKPLDRATQKNPLGMVTTSATRRVIIVLEPGTLVPYSIHTERADVVEQGHPRNPSEKPDTDRYLQLDDFTFSYGPAGGQKL